jgi:hypothetical protein
MMRGGSPRRSLSKGKGTGLASTVGMLALCEDRDRAVKVGGFPTFQMSRGSLEKTRSKNGTSTAMPVTSCGTSCVIPSRFLVGDTGFRACTLTRTGNAAFQKFPAISKVVARIQKVAEREGLPRQRHKFNKIRHFSQARTRRVYQSCVPKSTDFAPPSARAA